MTKVINAKLIINNIPEDETLGYVVARLFDSYLWYYGNYETQDEAQKVAETFENGVVVLLD